MEWIKNLKFFYFASVAKNEYVLISDIDVLILTKLKPNEVIAKLRKEGFNEPFEFHVKK
jgi:predicted nucleotidyltransferase